MSSSVAVPMILSFATVPLISTAQTIEKPVKNTDIISKQSRITEWGRSFMLF